jgi:pimeloyl-ACP methyl ester carboxylesterase
MCPSTAELGSSSVDGPERALLLPGSVLPAEPAYADLITALGPEVDAVAKNLEVYADPQPPAGYSLDTEIVGILREADARGWNYFHLVGYSGGGAAALAFAAKHPERLRSLSLLEPAWAGNWGWSDAHRALWAQFESLESLSPDEFMAAFVRLSVRPGVTVPPPPPGEQPPWMAQRPAGIRAFLNTFKTYDLDRDALGRFQAPVYFAIGGLSNPDQYGEVAERLSQVFPDFRLEVFPDRHHFDPPHRIEPERLAASLRSTWFTARQAALRS